MSRGNKLRATVVLEVMWDWRSMTSNAEYVEQAPKWFTINPNNFTGRRLHWFLGHNDFLVTNACPELVSSPNHRGTPSKDWLKSNLKEMYDRWKFDTVFICGSVARSIYEHNWLPLVRTIYMPHPAFRGWNRTTLDEAKRRIQSEQSNLDLDYLRYPHKEEQGKTKGILFE